MKVLRKQKKKINTTIPHCSYTADMGQLDTMFNMLRMGYQKSNIKVLKENLDMLRTMMLQKTAGQEPYRKKSEVNIDENLSMVLNSIIIESMCLYLSGDLAKLENLLKEEKNNE